MIVLFMLGAFVPFSHSEEMLACGIFEALQSIDCSGFDHR